MIFILNALKVIFVLGFLVLIHEGGHFLVSRLCKVKVNEFSIGFGPKIFSKQGKKTNYSLRLIPLGGYVNLEGEEQKSDEEGSYSNASIPKRMAIILAGGLVNIIFGLIVYFTLMSLTGTNVIPVAQKLIAGYAAAETGNILPGDEILKINDSVINVKKDIDKALDNSNGEELKILIKRNNEEKEIFITPTKQEYKVTGIYLKSKNSGDSTKILTVGKNSIAEKQGIRANDVILKVNNMEVKNQDEITDLITLAVKKVKLTLKRGNEILDIEIEPETMNKYFLGIEFKIAENNFTNNIYYAFFETKDFVFSLFDNLKMLFTGNVGIDQMVGPVGISEAVASTKEVEDFVYLMALISLSLGITNLLPFPALDGGKFVLLIVEAIRRKKISEKVETNITLIGFSILVLLAIYVTYNDILRLL